MSSTSPTKSGGPRLSEVARHVCLPSGIVSTGWPSVQRRLTDMGVKPDPWQEGIGRAALAKRESGLYAAGVGGAVLSIPRQTGKTFTIGAIIFALCSLNPDLLVLWSAHRSKTHNETFRSMKSTALRQKVAPHIEAVRESHGEEAVTFRNGSRILFGAREQGFGRGFPGVDILVLDEAQILTEKAMDDMVPATNAAPNGLVFLMGTPPRPSDPGEVFTNRRNDALAGDEDTLYVEFSADEDAKPEDRKQWAKANPSFPRRTSESAILRMRKLLGSDDSFRREAMGIWDEEIGPARAVRSSEWDALRIDEDEIPEDGRRVFGVRFTVDGSAVALAAALRPENGGPIHVEGVRLASTGDGTEWLVDWLSSRKERTAQIVIDGKAGVGYLVDALLAEKVPKKAILTPSTDDVIAAHSMTLEAIKSGGLTHKDQEFLNDHVKQATKREIGKSGGFGWAPATEEGSVALFDAATLALWGAKTTKRKPGRKAGFL